MLIANITYWIFSGTHDTFTVKERGLRLKERKSSRTTHSTNQHLWLLVGKNVWVGQCQNWPVWLLNENFSSQLKQLLAVGLQCGLGLVLEANSDKVRALQLNLRTKNRQSRHMLVLGGRNSVTSWPLLGVRSYWAYHLRVKSWFDSGWWGCLWLHFYKGCISFFLSSLTIKDCQVWWRLNDSREGYLMLRWTSVSWWDT